MKTTSEWIRLHALSTVGMVERFTIEQVHEHVDARLSRCFGLIRARVGLGFLRYESNRGRSPCYLAWLEQSLDKYKQTGNLDALLDVAFYAIAEIENPSKDGTYLDGGDTQRSGDEL